MKLTCSRCQRTGRDRGNWNGQFRAGRLVALICPRCQSADENAEAEINEATSEYAVNPLGIAVQRPRGVA